MLSLLVVDPSPDRRKAHTEHLSKRFNLRTASTSDRAISLFKETLPDIVLCAFRLNRSNGLLICSSMRPIKSQSTVIVYGVNMTKRKSKRQSSDVDISLPSFPRSEQLEVLALHNLVSRHQETDATSPEQNRYWHELVSKEPMLQHISNLLRANDSVPQKKLIPQIKKLIQTGQSSPLTNQNVPLVVFSEPNQRQRQELVNHFGNRLRLMFVSNPADLPPFIRRQPVSAAIIHQPQFDPELIPKIRGAQEKPFPIIAHGTNQNLPVDRRVQNNMSPPLLEVVLWEEVTRFDSFDHHKTNASPRIDVLVQSANRSDEEVAARSTWKELLTSKANMTSIRRLFKKEINS
jgi:CheY-like chemotaxis protein